MPRPPLPSDVYRLRIADGATPVARWPRRGRGAHDRRSAARRVPDGPVARPDDRGRAAPADTRHQEGPPSALLAGRPDPRVPVGSTADRRRGAGPSDRGIRSRGRHPGPPAPARRWRGAPPDRPATRRGGLRVVSGWRLAGRHLVIARGDVPGRRASARAGGSPRHACAARIRRALHRPARLHAQRRRVHVRQGQAPVDRRRRDGLRAQADLRSHAGIVPGLVAGRPADRVRRRPAPRSRPARAERHLRRRRRDRRGHGCHPRSALALRSSDVAARRIDDRGARSPAPGGHGQPQRRVALRRGRERRTTRRWAQPVRHGTT